MSTGGAKIENSKFVMREQMLKTSISEIGATAVFLFFNHEIYIICLATDLKFNITNMFCKCRNL